MTVSSATNRASLSGDGSTHSFAYGFKIFADTDLTVIVRASTGSETTKTLNTEYVVTGAGEASGGTVLFKYNTTSAGGSTSDAHYSATDYRPASGETVILLREQPLTQSLDMVANDPFPAAGFENSLDKLTFMVQQHEETLGRTFKVSKTNTISSSEFVDNASTQP